MSNRDKVFRIVAVCNDMYLKLHPDYENGYSGDRKHEAFQVSSAYGMNEVVYVLPGGTGAREMSGMCSWSELASFADGLYNGFRYGG